MNRNPLLNVAFFVVFIVFVVSAKAQDIATQRLLRNIPESANFLVSVKAKTLREKASTATGQEIKALVAQANSWAIISPWQPEQILMASELDIQHMQPSWEMATISFAKQPDCDQIAEQQDAVVDQLAGHPVVWLPDSCVVKTGPHELTIGTQRNRQSITRWLQQIDSGKSLTLSPFLTEYTTAGMTTSEIGMAIDMTNVFRIAEIQAAVKNSPLLSKLNTDPTNILASIRGVTIDCLLTGDQDSCLSIVFGESVEPLESIAKPLVYAALVRSGAMLEEFNQWNVQAVGKKITLTGKLSPAGLRRVLSLATIGTVAARAHATPQTETPVESTPAAEASSDEPAASFEEDEETTRTRRATLRYFNQITSSLDSLRGRGNEIKLQHNGLWINNYAKQIDTQLTRNVDAQMVEYGKTVANGLQQIVEQIYSSEQKRKIKDATGTPIIGRTEVAAVPYRRINVGGQHHYRYAPMVRQNLNIGAAMQERRANQTIKDAEISNAAMAIMKNIEAATETIRTEMSRKYHVEF